MILSEIEPGQIDGLWNRYVPALDEYLRRWPHNIEWKKDDVKDAIRKKTARLVNVYDGDNQVAFFLYRNFQEEFGNTKYIHLWLGYVYPDHRGRVREFLPSMFQYLNKISRKTGAKYIEMDSPRSGWERIMERFEMNPRRTVYRKEVGS